MNSIRQVIFVAGARTVFTGDLLRVDDRGVMNVVKAMQVGGCVFVCQCYKGRACFVCTVWGWGQLGVHTARAQQPRLEC